jgi:hypothetical protein
VQSGHRADTEVYERSAVSAINRWTPNRKGRFYEVLSTAALTLIVIGVMVIVLNRPIKDDVAWLLYVGKEVLHGRQLYVDLIEINPPLIVLISALAVWVSNLIGVHATAFYLIMFGGVLLVLAWFTSHILRHYFSMPRLHRYSFAFIGSVFFVIPGAEFGQREHLLLALLSPYLALLAVRLHGEKCSVQTAFIAGILCGLGLALKPQYLLAVLILESWLWVRGIRWFRPETLALAAALFAYGASIVLFFPPISLMSCRSLPAYMVPVTHPRSACSSMLGSWSHRSQSPSSFSLPGSGAGAKSR